LIANITIGQYYPADSTVHSLDPRLKLLAVLVYITSLFVASGPAGYIIAALCLAAVIAISRVPVKFILKGLKGILFLMLFTAGLHIFFTTGETLIFSAWIIKVYMEGVAMALLMGSRLVLLVMASSVLTLTTSPLELADALERVLKPFKRVGLPAHEIAMMMTIALRFIPTLIEEMDKIMKAQTARGADFDTGGVVKKAKSLIPLLVPLFISSFRRADDLAMAMEARCYRGDINRTRMNTLKMTRMDFWAMGILAAYLGIIILAKIFLEA
jgi:energy-coupling factor transport system permease protein